MSEKPVSSIEDYHAHIYYDAASKPRAEALRTALEREFPEASFGRWHDRPIGLHPDWSYQVAFGPALFPTIVPWLALNRGELAVFIHPNTSDALADHRDYALWMGAVRELDLSVLG